MQWSLIKSWAKQKGYETFREKTEGQKNQYDYYWGKIDDPTASGLATSVNKLAFDIFNHMTNYIHVDYQNKYKLEQAEKDINHNDLSTERW